MEENQRLREPKTGFEAGFTVEHILLSVTVVSTNKIIQYDDSVAMILADGLREYTGVESVKADVLYQHTKVETHPNSCTCHFCMLGAGGHSK